MSAAPKVVAVEVERYDGQKIQLPLKPRPMPIPTAIDILQRQHAAESKITEFRDTIPVYPWDGAIALKKAIEELFGIVLPEHTTMLPVAISATETIRVPWGEFALPGLKDAYVTTGIQPDEHGRSVFGLTVRAYMRDQPSIEALFARVRELALSQSIYRGKSLDFSFKGGQDGLPSLTFKSLPTTKAIFSKPLEEAIERNILVPIWYTEACRRSGIPLKRGILLAGPYGGGKTLLAANVAIEANRNDWTFLEVKDAKEIEQAIAFARQIGPTVMLVEDIDRVVGPERTDAVNKINNMIDGAGTKDLELIMLFTSNHPERINEMTRRDGRIDVTLPIEAPDAEAVQRLVQQFGATSLEPNADLTAVGSIMEKSRPSKIRETVERSKLEALRRTAGFSSAINGDDLAATAQEVLTEAKLFTPKVEKHCPMTRIGMGIAEGIGNGLMEVASKVHANGNRIEAASE
jgi:ATPase family protein associated with various cellular activities (AAA)